MGGIVPGNALTYVIDGNQVSVSELHIENLTIVNTANTVRILIQLPPRLFVERIREHVDNIYVNTV